MSDQKIWFVLNAGQVTGPFDSNEVEHQANQFAQAQIWGRGQTEWVTFDKWKKNLQANHQILPIKQTAPNLWKLRVEGKERDLLSYDQLIKFLKTNTDYAVIDVSPEGSDVWTEVFGVPRIVEDLGITRRSHPRVPIVGILKCESANGPFQCRVISISEGGLGVNDAINLSIGMKFAGTLESPNLFSKIASTFEVVYVGKDGYAGLRFVGIADESKNSIIEYVRKFTS